MLIFSIFSCDSNSEMINEGNKIVEKIERYRKENNQLPTSLEDIGVKETMEGPFYYRKQDSIYYSVWFSTSSVGEGMYYYSDTKEWDYRLRAMPKDK